MAPRWGHGADWDNAERVIHRTGWGRWRPDRCRRCVGVPTQILDQDLEAEAQRPVRLQVVAGPRNHRSRSWKRTADKPDSLSSRLVPTVSTNRFGPPAIPWV